MGRLARVEVTPFHAQVEISDPNARDYPQWPTGDELVVSLPQCVAVATQGDDRGKVAIEVWDKSLDANDPEMGTVLFDGEFVTTTNRVMVGNIVGNDLHTISTREGRHRLRVYTSPAHGRARAVYFLLSQAR